MAMADTTITSTTEDPRKWVPKTGSPTTNQSTFFEEWVNAIPASSTPWIVGNNLWFFGTNGGSISGVAAAGALGVVQLSSTTGHAVVYQDATAVVLGSNQTEIRMRVRLPTLPTTAQDFYVNLGLGDTISSGENVDGVYFYCDSTSPYWKIRTRSNSIETSVTTTATISANTWYTLQMIINATGSLVTFKVGTSTASLVEVGTISTNIPVGESRSTGPILKINKINGNNAKLVQCDYYLMYTLLGTER
jgi:hypothetical protein